MPIISNLKRKIRRGIYDHDKENDLSKVYIRLASEVLGNFQIKYNEFVPDLLREHYKLVWEKLSKHVFVEAETN